VRGNRVASSAFARSWLTNRPLGGSDQRSNLLPPGYDAQFFELQFMCDQDKTVIEQASRTRPGTLSVE